ncbi:hypothetical protein [Streptomyces phaeochromogenes]|uniref:hypothetical protein n=1 Tax=Streptomyces phaeochromogenes TaxID=1923 RepID=UPI002DDC0558|nr:hypothetical protein [Streptomyces phaeochromogenes]WRZ27285.1 hypothetical protein OG931_05750 [Streptomyces phaeochromogenes]
MGSMGNKWVLRHPARLIVALLAGFALVLTGTGAAHATTTVEIPAGAEGGVSATVKFYGTVVPQPYNPDPTAYFGDRKCQLIYHDYDPTAGCGGFKLGVVLHNVRNQPGYLAGLNSTGNYFQAHADTARTFGCLRADGSFDHGTSFVVRTEQQRLGSTYYEPDSNWILSAHRNYEGEFGPHFFVNFPPVEVNCPAGMTATQYGLKVSNVNISIDDANVFGTTTWSTPGPFYG